MFLTLYCFVYAQRQKNHAQYESERMSCPSNICCVELADLIMTPGQKSWMFFMYWAQDKKWLLKQLNYSETTQKSMISIYSTLDTQAVVTSFEQSSSVFIWFSCPGCLKVQVLLWSAGKHRAETHLKDIKDKLLHLKVTVISKCSNWSLILKWHIQHLVSPWPITVVTERKSTFLVLKLWIDVSEDIIQRGFKKSEYCKTWDEEQQDIHRHQFN